MRLRNAMVAANGGDPSVALTQPSLNNPNQTSQRGTVEEVSEYRRNIRGRKASLITSKPKLASTSSSVKKPAVRWVQPDFWRTCDIPVEIFEIIAIFLSRDDLLRMRLVNRDFEKKISRHVFRTVVVPFKPNIYGMVDKGTGKIGIKTGVSHAEARPSGKSNESQFYVLATCV